MFCNNSLQTSKVGKVFNANIEHEMQLIPPNTKAYVHQIYDTKSFRDSKQGHYNAQRISNKMSC